ncbi:hypothetical protein HDU99_002878 [Rhizoclosmatium hyalinum]|nr:hypothetical protein HDU99_002877 [Rhizoclosmatium hyalinum]KAJ3084164.1 hypothetical protein HDU99_002878 [Rhizoclosmatium hyalinum]
MKLIYVALALAASVIAAPADVEKRAFKHTKRPPPRTVSSWSGNYNDQYDDGIIGAKTLPNKAVSPHPFTGVIGTPCNDGKDAATCTQPNAKGVSKMAQCHRKGWMYYQCDFGFNCAIDTMDPLLRPHCVTLGH